ncbi:MULTISPECIES: hypothetical protein [Cytobacillus]|nr:hypothetical protein [Cytobacillus kochii]
MINHIGPFNASVIAPNKTTVAPIIRACHIGNPLLRRVLPMK